MRKFLEPLRSQPRERPFLVYDVESKAEDTQEPGLTRPFRVCLYDGTSPQVFTNHPALSRLPWQERHLARGGCIDRFLRTVLVPKYIGYNLYAHSGGKFDHLFLPAWLTKHREEFAFEAIPVQTSILIFRVWRRYDAEKAERQKKAKEEWTFLDSMNLLPMPLQTASKTMGLAGKKEMDLSLHEDDPRWQERVTNDCVQLYQVLGKTHDIVSNLKGEVGVSASATSMRLFLRNYLGKGTAPSKIPVYRHFPGCTDPECLGCFHKWIRKGLHGGRTEILTTKGGGCRKCIADGFDPYGVILKSELKIGSVDTTSPNPSCFACKGTGIDPEKYARYYDINGSYMASMCEGMPIGDRIFVSPDPKTGQPPLDWRMRDTHVGFIECDVFIPESCQLPPLPTKRKKDGRLIFKTGYLSGIWDADELALLFDPAVQGKILKVHQVVWIGRKPVFHEMMEELWKLRDKSLPEFDAGKSLLSKHFGNGLSGKFAMKEERTSIALADKPRAGFCIVCGAPTGEHHLCKGCIGSKPATPIETEDRFGKDSGVWFKRHRMVPPYIIPQITFHVVASGRVRLWKYCQQALQKGGTLMQVDTDCVITDVDLPSSIHLGEMKDEYPGEPFKIVSIQCKAYMIEKEKPFEGEHTAACTSSCKDPVCEKDTCPKCHGCSTSKVTLKGFPKSVRTKENLLRLMRGEKVSYQILQKIRGLAQNRFETSPIMLSVDKAFRTPYDKRKVLPDGSTRPWFSKRVHTQARGSIHE